MLDWYSVSWALLDLQSISLPSYTDIAIIANVDQVIALMEQVWCATRCPKTTFPG